MSHRIRTFIDNLLRLGSTKARGPLSALTAVSFTVLVASTMLYVASIPLIIGDGGGVSLAYDSVSDDPSAPAPSNDDTQDTNKPSSSDEEASTEEQQDTTVTPTQLATPTTKSATTSSSSTTGNQVSDASKSNPQAPRSATSADKQATASKTENGKRAAAGSSTSNSGNRSQSDATDSSNTSANSNSNTNSNANANTGSTNDEELYSTLNEQYNLLTAYVSQVNECTENFNKHSLDSSLTKRKKYRDVCDTLSNKILRNNPPVRNLLVPPNSKYHECHDELVGAYRTLWQYTSTLAAAWDENLKYDDPSKHIDDFMEPLTYNSVSGKCKHLAEFEEYYKRQSHELFRKRHKKSSIEDARQQRKPEIDSPR